MTFNWKPALLVLALLSQAEAVQIYVVLLDGTKKTLNVELSSDRIGHVKRKAQVVTGIPAYQQRLIFAGKQLEDSSTLASQNVMSGSILHLLRRSIAPLSPDSITSVTSRTSTSFTVAWMHAAKTSSYYPTCGNRTLVLAKPVDTGIAGPEDGTSYAGNAVFGSGAQIGSSGWYAVANEADSLVTVSNLQSGTRYRVQLFAYDTASDTIRYNGNALPNNPVTIRTGYAIFTSASAGGHIESTLLDIDSGAQAMISIQPDNGYVMDSLWVDRGLVTPNELVIFDTIISNHTVRASFRAISKSVHIAKENTRLTIVLGGNRILGFETEENSHIVLELVDLRGRKVYQESFPAVADIRLDQAHLPRQGIFLLKLLQGDKNLHKMIFLAR